MAQQITYNSKTITFPTNHLERIPSDPRRLALVGVPVDGVSVETLNVAMESRVLVSLMKFNDVEAAHQTLRRNLLQWYAWASMGKAWTFAYDSSDTVLTTLAAGANAGSSSVEVSSATGIVAGRQYVIRSATQLDIVRVASIDGTTLTLTESLNFDFADGDRFRTLRYWPARLADLSRNPIVERPPLMWDLQLEFIEDLNSL